MLDFLLSISTSLHPSSISYLYYPLPLATPRNLLTVHCAYSCISRAIPASNLSFVPRIPPPRPPLRVTTSRWRPLRRLRRHQLLLRVLLRKVVFSRALILLNMTLNSRSYYSSSRYVHVPTAMTRNGIMKKPHMHNFYSKDLPANMFTRQLSSSFSAVSSIILSPKSANLES
jgi:hypothetical protein